MKTPVARTLVAAALILTVVATPTAALAQSTDSVSSIRAQIESLMKQMEALKQQLKNAQGSSTPMMKEKTASTTPPGLKRACPTPVRNLGRGSSGDDVKQLQKFLSESDPTLLPPTAVTGTFGPITAEAVRKFQHKHGIASSTTGFVGPMTREFFGKRCGELLGQKRGQQEVGEDRKGPNRGPEAGDDSKGQNRGPGKSATTTNP